jgi:hypothetical protein
MKPAVVFGDVHGQADQLEKLIKEVRSRFGFDVDIYTLGDLIDRGPDSKGVIDICAREEIKGVYGNHDQWLHDFVLRGVFDPICMHPSMGGTKTLSSYGVGWKSFLDRYPMDKRRAHLAIANDLNKKMPEHHKAFLLGLEPFLPIWAGEDEEKFWLIHAGLKEATALGFKEDGMSDEDILSGIAGGAMSVNSLLWPRPGVGRHDKDPVDLYRFEDGKQILGHTVCWNPMLGEFFCAIDTGCGTMHPWTLTGLILPSMEIIQIGPKTDWAE